MSDRKIQMFEREFSLSWALRNAYQSAIRVLEKDFSDWAGTGPLALRHFWVLADLKI